MYFSFSVSLVEKGKKKEVDEKLLGRPSIVAPTVCPSDYTTFIHFLILMYLCSCEICLLLPPQGIQLDLLHLDQSPVSLVDIHVSLTILAVVTCGLANLVLKVKIPVSNTPGTMKGEETR